MIAQSVAEWIAGEHRDRKVLFVALNGKAGTEYRSKSGESIENLKIFLDNLLLARREVLESSKVTENFHFIGGIHDPRKARHFSPQNAVYFLDSLKDEFDVVIADTGNDLDNGLAVGALEKTAERFLLLTQHESMLKRTEALLTISTQMGLSFPHWIMNKYAADDPYDIPYIAKRVGLPVETCFRVEKSLYSRQAEREYRTLLQYKDGVFKADIARVGSYILQKSGIGPAETVKRKKWKPSIWMTT